MSYFPVDIPFMPEEELKENGIRIPKIETANEVIKFAEDVLHIELLPWQKYFIANVLAIGVTKDAEGSEERGVTTVEKLKAYEEQQKADKIVVGDEVEWEGEKIIVTQTFTPNLQKPQLHGIGSNGCVYYAILIEDVKKTGRHFPQVVELIKAMKEGAE